MEENDKLKFSEISILYLHFHIYNMQLIIKLYFKL